MTILITDKDFADAVKNNERIQNKTIYWIGEEPNFSCLGLAPVAFAQTKYEIGKYYPNKGVYAGELKKQDGFYGIFASLQDAGEKDEDGEEIELLDDVDDDNFSSADTYGFKRTEFCLKNFGE